MMDIFTIFFILSTLWVGPYWFAMILKPYDNKTNKLLSTPFFFIGPIIIWFLVMLINPSGLVDFLNSGSHPDGFFAGISKGIATDAGITAMWAHMVAGDICATRWIWKDGIRKNTNIWILRISLFFGVMLMPLGVGIHLLFRNKFVRK